MHTEISPSPFSTPARQPSTLCEAPYQRKKFRVITLDDDDVARDIYSAALAATGCQTTCLSKIEELGQILTSRFYDAVLTDHHLTRKNGEDVLKAVTRISPFTKIFVMTGDETVGLAVHLMEQGASSFIPKSIGPYEGAKRIVRHLERSHHLPHTTEDFGIIGTSHAIRQVHSQINLIKDTNAHVLISGESGTGKELVANALHNASHRKAHRFEAINCGAIPEALLESELFGHKRGAFTDAKTSKRGLFEVCQNGTLFLDEIGDMPMTLQVKLLRVLQDREIRPIGSEQTIKINTRVVAATNKNLAEEVSKGLFREDLYYRLSVLDIHTPPLRDRVEDIMVLFNVFLHFFSEQNQKPVHPLAHDVARKVESWPWPGNVRELRNAVERSVILSTDGHIHCEHLFQRSKDIPSYKDDVALEHDVLHPYRFHEAKTDFEMSYLHQLLTKTSGNIAEAARLSGKTRVEIYRLIDRNHMNISQYRH